MQSNQQLLAYSPDVTGRQGCIGSEPHSEQARAFSPGTTGRLNIERW